MNCKARARFLHHFLSTGLDIKDRHHLSLILLPKQISSDPRSPINIKCDRSLCITGSDVSVCAVTQAAVDVWHIRQRSCV